jgi:hypothetical protein
MANRTLVEYVEDRPNPESRYDHLIEIQRSAAGQPGLLITNSVEYRNNDGSYNSEAEVTVLIKDGVALIAPVLAWLLNNDLVEEVAKERYERAPGLDFTRGWEGAPDDVQDEFREMVRNDIQALIAVGQRRVDADTTEDGRRG